MLRKPELIATQLIQIIGQFPFDNQRGNDPYVSLLTEKLFDKGQTVDDTDQSVDAALESTVRC